MRENLFITSIIHHHSVPGDVTHVTSFSFGLFPIRGRHSRYLHFYDIAFVFTVGCPSCHQPSLQRENWTTYLPPKGGGVPLKSFGVTRQGECTLSLPTAKRTLQPLHHRVGCVVVRVTLLNKYFGSNCEYKIPTK